MNRLEIKIVIIITNKHNVKTFAASKSLSGNNSAISYRPQRNTETVLTITEYVATAPKSSGRKRRDMIGVAIMVINLATRFPVERVVIFLIKRIIT